jgi:hypothetical protein
MLFIPSPPVTFDQHDDPEYTAQSNGLKIQTVSSGDALSGRREPLAVARLM